VPRGALPAPSGTGGGPGILRPGPVANLKPAPIRGRILVADDNPMNLKVARSMLASFGYAPDLAGGGYEALAAMERSTYDLVFLDCNMPGMDGFAVTREVRAREGEGRHTPIIALTASALGGAREKCLAMGMDGYLSKPLRPEVLKGVLDHWLGHGEAPPEGDLAAGNLPLTGWEPGTPVLDPVCGSGPVPAETAAMGPRNATGVSPPIAIEKAKSPQPAA